MKKTILFEVITFIAATTFLVSCGNSIEKDANSVADLMCKSVELRNKATNGDMDALKEAEKLEETVQKLVEKLEAKYTNEADKKAFLDQMEKNYQNCSKK